SNPSSMAVAIENFLQLDSSSKILVLGDMFELGEESNQEHKSLVEMLLNDNEVKCYFIGTAFYNNKLEKSNFNFYKTFEDFTFDLATNALIDNTILIKGSRGMALERTLDFIPG
ncbi:UDP-N-acetylmuramoyl-tripeptide--D-alanyl-D-alanine ligase, partial [Flavobacterium sp. XS1P32]